MSFICFVLSLALGLSLNVLFWSFLVFEKFQVWMFEVLKFWSLKGFNLEVSSFDFAIIIISKL